MIPTGAAAGGVVSKAFSKLGRWARRAKLKTRQGGIGKKGGAGRGEKKASAKQSSQQAGAAKEGNYLDDVANISSLSGKIIKLNKAISGGGVIQNTSAYQIVASASYYSTPLEQGSAIFRGIIQNHLFIDGNHRTAVEACKYFASENGIKVELSNSKLMSIAKKVSAGQLDDVYAIGATLSK